MRTASSRRIDLHTPAFESLAPSNLASALRDTPNTPLLVLNKSADKLGARVRETRATSYADNAL